NIDRLIEFLDDVDDRSSDGWALIVVAGWHATLVDQHHDGFHALALQFRHQRVHGRNLIAEFEAGGARRRDDLGRALPRQPDAGDGNAVEGLDLVGREKSLSGVLYDG